MRKCSCVDDNSFDVNPRFKFDIHENFLALDMTTHFKTLQYLHFSSGVSSKVLLKMKILDSYFLTQMHILQCKISKFRDNLLLRNYTHKTLYK